MKTPKCMLFVAAIGLATSVLGSTNVVNYWTLPNGVNKVGWTRPSGGSDSAKNQCGWSGTMWGKSVYFQGDTSMSRYDSHEKVGSTLYYTSTYCGNFSPDASAAFSTPIVWLTDNQSVSTGTDTNYNVENLAPVNRDQGVSSNYTGRVEFTTAYSAGTYYHPELNGGGYLSSSWGPVYHVKWWPNKFNSSSLEEYWLVEGHSWVRFYWHGNGLIEYYDPAQTQTGVTIPDSTATPANPFYDIEGTPVTFSSGPYHTFQWNGAFEKADGGGNHLTGWSVSDPSYVVYTTDGGTVPTDAWGKDEAGSMHCCIRGGTGYPLSASFKSFYWIPVKPGKDYTLSGWVFRVNGGGDVYLDLDSGNGANSSGGAASLTNTVAYSGTTGTWEYISADVTIPSGVYGVHIRGVREVGSTGNAYFDDIRLSAKQ